MLRLEILPLEQSKNSLISNKYIQLVKNYYDKLYTYLVSEAGMRDLAMLPLFFNWLPFLLFKYENPVIRKSSIYSMLFACYFFVCFIGSGLLNIIPFVGSLLANILHLIGVITYLGLSGFFIYSYHRNKTLDMAVLDRHYNFLVTKLF
jgi:uncharacterized membrane protein